MRPRRRLRHFLLAAVRGFVAVLALLGYLASSIGFPAPAPAPAVAPRQNSSQDHPISCAGHTCCCTGSGPCCCCSAAQDEPLPSGTKEEPTAAADDAAPPVLLWVNGFQVRQCLGLDQLWSALNAVLPLPPPLSWAYEWQPAGWLPLLSSLAESSASPPPTPPPRA